jgi:predicted MFS family arabinose efflux permease
MLVTADLLRAILLLPLLFAHTASTIWLVYPIAFSVQVVGQFFTPAAGALLPRLVTREDLPAANAWFSFGGSFTLLAGPSLGGFLLGVAGWSSIIVVDSSSFVLSAVLIGCVSLPSGQPVADIVQHPCQAAPWLSYWHDWVVGPRIVAHTPLLSTLFAVSGLVTMLSGCFVVMIVPYVREVLHGQAQLLGLLASAQGAGGIVGGLLFVRLATKIPPRRVLVFGFCMIGVALLICFNSMVSAVVVALWVLVGLLLAATGIAERTLLQCATTDATRGRVLGTLGTTNALAGLMGMSIASTAGARFGILPILDTMAGLSLLTGVLCLSVARLERRPMNRIGKDRLPPVRMRV